MASFSNDPYEDAEDYRTLEDGSIEVLIRVDGKLFWINQPNGFVPDTFDEMRAAQRRNNAAKAQADAVSDNQHKLQEELQELISLDLELYAEQMVRRKRILKVAEAYLPMIGKTWLGMSNKYYLGPDVDNSKLIFVIGAKANLPVKQMKEDGKRTPNRKRPGKQTVTRMDLGI